MPHLERCVHATREHRPFTVQVFPVVSATACDRFMTVEAARQALPVFKGEADHKVDKSAQAPSTSVTDSDAYGTNEMYGGDLKDADWDQNDTESTFEGANAVRVCKVRANSMNVQESRRMARLRL